MRKDVKVVCGAKEGHILPFCHGLEFAHLKDQVTTCWGLSCIARKKKKIVQMLDKRIIIGINTKVFR